MIEIEKWFRENCVQQYPVQFGRYVVVVDAEGPEQAERKAHIAIAKSGNQIISGHPFKALEPQWRMR